jgi:hypothetical protein
MSKKVESKKQKEIDQIIKLRNTEIRNVLNGNNRIMSNKKNPIDRRSILEKAVATAMPFLFFAAIYILHGVLNLGNTTNTFFQYSYRLFLFSIIYGAIAMLINAQLLNMSFSAKNVSRLFTSLSSLAPVLVTLLLLRSYPELTSPIDNTLGYWMTKDGPNKGAHPMSYFESTIFPKSTLKQFGEDVRIPFDWLLTTFDLNNIESILDKLKSKADISTLSSQTGIVPDFYLNIEKGTPDYESFKASLIDMIKAKHSVGHMVVTLIACAAGVAMSLGISMSTK